MQYPTIYKNLLFNLIIIKMKIEINLPNIKSETILDHCKIELEKWLYEVNEGKKSFNKSYNEVKRSAIELANELNSKCGLDLFELNNMNTIGCIRVKSKNIHKLPLAIDFKMNVTTVYYSGTINSNIPSYHRFNSSRIELKYMINNPYSLDEEITELNFFKKLEMYVMQVLLSNNTN